MYLKCNFLKVFLSKIQYSSEEPRSNTTSEDELVFYFYQIIRIKKTYKLFDDAPKKDRK